jgi:two-component system CheB/CheR fusion protein
MTEPPVEAILEYLRRSRGFDFTAYKRTSLKRRLDKRMQAVGISDYDAYLDYLEVHPGEFASLFNTILINVTAFFRDEPVWDLVARQVIPEMVASKTSSEPLRVWSAGSASGEEAYTMAILLAEALGPDAFRERVKIYATDVDEEALLQARQAIYSPRHVESVPGPLLEKYFERTNSNYVFNRDLRRSVILGRHDLIQDAPISRVDFLICRNTLMYFNAEVQTKILTRFYFALNDGGCLLLGKAEMLFNHTSMFTPVDLKRRLFRVVPRRSQRERLLMLAQAGRDLNPPLGDHSELQIRHAAAFETDSMPQIVLDTSGSVVLANDGARRQFGLSVADLGKPLQDLELSYRPVELRSHVERVVAERLPTAIKDVQWQAAPGDFRYYDVWISPLLDGAGRTLGTKIAFPDVTLYRRMKEELTHSKQELETAYEELQSTNEELETTNEELQSTVEELETTNEELQSTNEELETMNEELQSTNEELQTMNDELRARTGQLNDVNGFLEAILTSLSAAIVVVDRNLQVQVWNYRAEDLWGLRENEVRGTSLLALDIGFPMHSLTDALRATLAGSAEPIVVLADATNRRGRRLTCRVTCSPLVGMQGEAKGVILVMEENPTPVDTVH